MTNNAHLHVAKKAREDEFYTELSDIERELRHYRDHFEGKTVYLNCDDPRKSGFFHYFSYNFEQLGLKRLISTCYRSEDAHAFSKGDSDKGVWLEYTGDRNASGTPDVEEIDVWPLEGDGDFRSPECVELLQQADIVVTNPPFSLWREYIDQLMEFDKQFLILGPMNAITYKEIFPLIQEDRMWLGYHTGDMSFRVPDDYPPRKTRFWVDETGQKWRSMGNVYWYTNLDHSKRHEELILVRNYDPEKYPTYDNADAINVDRVADIPADWDGLMGVPITFLEKHNPDQFELVKFRKGDDGRDLCVAGEYPYFRILIRRKQ